MHVPVLLQVYCGAVDAKTLPHFTLGAPWDYAKPNEARPKSSGMPFVPLNERRASIAQWISGYVGTRYIHRA